MLKNKLSFLEAKPELLKLNIQFFADKGEGDPSEGKDKDAPPEDVTLTQEELDKKIEAEADRKLAKALDKKQAEWDAKLEKKLAEERKSAEEYAKLTAKEKEDADYKKRLSELDKREQELNSKQLLSQIETDLKESNLPVSFATSLLSIGKSEQIKEAITGIKKDFDAAVAEQVKVALRQETPPSGDGGLNTNKGFDIAKMARAARVIK